MWISRAILPKALLSSDPIEKGLDFPDAFLYHKLHVDVSNSVVATFRLRLYAQAEACDYHC